MVVHSKRKRKEDSPEMPKRTKVQAQRKFAQGQSAPVSAYSTVNVASSSSNTGPSTSSESREPPTELLPNKRPRTDDFLTFLCFRGTSALPAHLDFLNQGKTKETESPVKKTPKPTKATKKGKKGRAKATGKGTPAAKGTSTSANAKNSDKGKPLATAANSEKGSNTALAATETATTAKNTVDDSKRAKNADNVIPFAVRKRAEIVVEGNRRGGRTTERQLRNTAQETEKCNSSPEIKRRSNRAIIKDNKPPAPDADTDDEDEYFSAKEEATKADELDKDIPIRKNESRNTKLLVSQDRKSETPSKESETGKSRKGRSIVAAKKVKEVPKENATEANISNESQKAVQKQEQMPKDKPPPTKRTRQKESPIFIPSPEPSGRMTRQRAFFEPVKVLPRTEGEDNVSEKKIEGTGKKGNNKNDIPETKEIMGKDLVVKDDLTKMNTDNCYKTADNSKSKTPVKPDLNVFDFSSDDEQPLAKSIKIKKGKLSPKKSSPRISNRPGRKSNAKKSVTDNKANSTDGEAKNKTVNKDGNELKKEVAVDVAEDLLKAEKADEEKGKGKRGKLVKPKINENTDELNNVDTKKSTVARLSRKKGKVDDQTVNGEQGNERSSGPPTRNQRPTRKTKEAATIYMGIIGHKLQQADDEDDDLSLNSFPDLPNVKEMEKMEIELKKNAAQNNSIPAKVTTITTSPTATKSSPKQSTPESPTTVEKPATGRRGRPPKQGKQIPAKREIEGMLVKKGDVTKLPAINELSANKTKVDPGKDESDDEDFLLNKEVNETKRKLEKSFSDSDDEPLAIKVNSKPGDKDIEHESKKSNSVPQNSTTPLSKLPVITKPVPTSPLTSQPTNASPIPTPQQQASTQAASPFKTIEKKSPIPTSKILNVPATYGIPSANSNTSNVNVPINTNFNKTATYLTQGPAHYQMPHARPTHQFPTAKSPTVPAPVVAPPHLTAPLPPQSPMKYQTPPTTYPPPIEAYPSPKINPNFLTPKFDRTSLPRNNNFPSPSPVKFDISTGAKIGIAAPTLSPKTTTSVPVSSTPVAVASAPNATPANSSDPLKDEIGSILAANLMPSKEESGKIFGIASVSLAQSSGPDNTKCTLGKCGSIHKPVLGPVVPTEGYIGDQLSSKERRKAKVNMTHEQIQKWLIECSSNPDEIQDDLEDDFDDNLRPNLFTTTPPPTRDDKESTSFSSSSKATRDLGKSESAWSAKGPSLKATPVVATVTRKEDSKQQLDGNNQTEIVTENDKNGNQTINTLPKSGIKQNSESNDAKTSKDKLDKKNDKKSKDDKSQSKDIVGQDNKSTKIGKEKDVQIPSTKTTAAGKQSNVMTASNQLSLESPSTSKQNRKRNVATPTSTPDDKNVTASTPKATGNAGGSSTSASKTPKRTPVYNQKAQKQIELKETTTTSHKKSAPFSYGGAFSVDNEKSIYSFDKDDDEDNTTKPITKPAAFRRQSRRDSIPEETAETTPPVNSRSSPNKKRAAAAAAEKANKDMANASQSSSVSLTLSPSENCKHVKVSLDAENTIAVKAAISSAPKKSKTNEAAAAANDPDSDSDGHTFYIPLQGAAVGGDGDGSIQGVAVKLGREGPDGPNQKVIMHATLVTKAQMGSNPKPLPDSMNVSDIVKTLISSSSVAVTATATNMCIESPNKGVNHNIANVVPSTSAAASAVTTTAGSLKSITIETVQSRAKVPEPANTTQATTSAAVGAGGSSLVRVNSNSSLFSGSAKSKIGGTAPTSATALAANKKFKDDTPIKMANNTAFPRHDDPTQMVEAPIFRPTQKEFADPMDFIERITPIAARFGICKIIPPATFKPECRISDEMRFTAYNQYVHKMLHRWGPSAKELSAIKKYLGTQSIVMNHPPWIGGMEVDLPRLYHTVQELGGLKEVIEKKKWARVAEEMCIPKLAQDRVTKLDDIYCKYLLPYDTLSPSERQKLFDEVEADWAKREARARRNADRFVNTESVSNEEDDVSSEDDEESEEEVDGVSMECIVKGRSMPLSQFYRIARNTMALWFKNTEPTVNEVEAEFWRHVAVRDSHVCVHSGSIDSSGWGYGFPSPGPKGKGSNYARHPWNLKVLTNNPGSVLRSLGPVMGVTVPTLHVGMLFSACCWYRDPHGLSWIEYLHTGASKLWYGIPDDQSANFRSALTSLIPTHCQNKTIWLPCDTVMVPPHMLTDRGVSLCRIEQKPGEFIVVFPRAYTSSLATGYVVSESVYFATTSWLDLAKDDFRDIHDSCEPAMFSLEQLLFALGHDQRVTPDTLQQMLPMLHEVFEKETAAREQLKAAGVTSMEKIHNEKGSKAKKQQPPFKSIESECDLCRANLYISMVRTDEGNVYCLQHALKNLNNGNIQAKQCNLIYAYNVDDINILIKAIKEKMQQKRYTSASRKLK